MHLITCLLALPFLILLTVTPIVQGRQLSKLTGAAMRINEEKWVGVIGSKPPRCEERCKSCGPCKAVQVPIVPRKKFFFQEKNPHQLFAKIAYNRGDGISNYKPMCWKCKCGDSIFNPW